MLVTRSLLLGSSLAYDLKQVHPDEIEKGCNQQQQKKIDQKRADLDEGGVP